MWSLCCFHYFKTKATPALIFWLYFPSVFNLILNNSLSLSVPEYRGNYCKSGSLSPAFTSVIFIGGMTVNSDWSYPSQSTPFLNEHPCNKIFLILIDKLSELFPKVAFITNSSIGTLVYLEIFCLRALTII